MTPIANHITVLLWAALLITLALRAAAPLAERFCLQHQQVVEACRRN